MGKNKLIDIDSSKKALSVRIISIIFSILIFVAFCIPLQFIFTENTAKAADKSSFYMVTNSLTSYVNKVTDTTDTGDGVGVRTSDSDNQDSLAKCTPIMGNAGIMFGYAESKKDEEDEDDDDGVLLWLLSSATANSVNFPFESLRKIDSELASGTNNPSLGYGYFGYALSEMHLDETSESGGGFLSTILGGLLIIFYTISAAVGYLFNLVIGILLKLNPFTLLSSAFKDSAVGNSDFWTENAVGKPIYEFVQNMITAVRETAWVAIVLLFAITLITALIFKASSNMGRNGNNIAGSIGKFFIRIVFLFLAIPFFGAAYTGALNYMKDPEGFGGNSYTAPNTAICKTIVDFENWALMQRLALPKDTSIKVNVKNGSIESDGTTAASTIALKINDNLGYEVSGSGSGSSANKYKIDYEKINPSDRINKNTIVVDDSVLALLRKYMANDTISPAAYEGALKANTKLSDKLRDIGDNDEATVKAVFAGKDDAKGDLGVISISRNVPDNGSGDGDTSLFNNATATYSNGLFKSKDDCKFGIKNLDLNSKNATAYIDRGHNQGLSCMSMFNYLNSKFSSSGIQVYSSEATASDYGREYHHSAVLVGESAAARVANYIDCLVLLIAIAILGFVYALQLIILSIRNGFRMITSAPLAMIGSINFIGKFIVAFIVTILEIVVTIFLYSLFCDLLVLLGEIFNGDNNSNNLFVLIKEFGHIIITIWFTWFAVKNRRAIVKSVDETLSDIVKRLSSSIGKGNNGGPSGGGGGGGQNRSISNINGGNNNSDNRGGDNNNNNNIDSDDNDNSNNNDQYADDDVNNDGDDNDQNSASDSYGASDGSGIEGAAGDVNTDNDAGDTANSSSYDTDQSNPENNMDNYNAAGEATGDAAAASGNREVDAQAGLTAASDADGHDDDGDRGKVNGKKAVAATAAGVVGTAAAGKAAQNKAVAAGGTGANSGKANSKNVQGNKSVTGDSSDGNKKDASEGNRSKRDVARGAVQKAKGAKAQAANTKAGKVAGGVIGAAGKTASTLMNPNKTMAAAGSAMDTMKSKASDAKTRLGQTRAGMSDRAVRKSDNVLKSHGVTGMSSYQSALSQAKQANGNVAGLRSAFGNVVARDGLSYAGRNIKATPQEINKCASKINELARYGERRTPQQTAEYERLCNIMKNKGVPITNGRINSSFAKGYEARFERARDGKM